VWSADKEREPVPVAGELYDQLEEATLNAALWRR
jgi:hypothetical protein